MNIEKVILIVLDSLGIGELPDAAAYGDAGSNTLCNLAQAVGGLHLPNLDKMGLGRIAPFKGSMLIDRPMASYGKMAEQSAGKDTTTGHWEMAGIKLAKPFPVYPNGFPTEIIREFENEIGRKTLGNYAASGTVIINELGKQHLETGYPIVYTSADSVFQIAAHEDVISIDLLYDYCKIARRILRDEHAVGRVIARPFLGEPGSFYRTPRRHDYSLTPPAPTILDELGEAGIPVIGIGKIKDIFSGKGINISIHTKNNAEGIRETINQISSVNRGFIFTNLVDFDMLYGHRNDPHGYAMALQEFDSAIPEIIKSLLENDILMITADHGCDPTTPSTDHSREYVPLIVFSKDKKCQGKDLGTRQTFADIAATIAEIFEVQNPGKGISFLSELKGNVS